MKIFEILVNKSGRPIAVLPENITRSDVARIISAYAKRRVEVRVARAPLAFIEKILQFD